MAAAGIICRAVEDFMGDIAGSVKSMGVRSSVSESLPVLL